MAAKRPWKVRFHYEASIGTGQPITGVTPYAEEISAHSLAKTVSRNGGTATVTYRNPTTGIETVIQTYQPSQP